MRRGGTDRVLGVRESRRTPSKLDRLDHEHGNAIAVDSLVQSSVHHAQRLPIQVKRVTDVPRATRRTLKRGLVDGLSRPRVLQVVRESWALARASRRDSAQSFPRHSS